MIRIPSIVTAGLALCLIVGAASAQTTPAPATPAAPAAPAPAAPTGKMTKPRTAQSIACSGKADAQGLHGKPRKTFMSTCKHAKM